MSNAVRITYINKSMNRDMPKTFLFMKNEIPTFDALREGVAWKVIENVRCGSSCQINFPIVIEVATSWDDHTYQTMRLPLSNGCCYSVLEDDTGIVLNADVNAGHTRSIDVVNNVHVKNGVSVDLYKDGQLMMTKKTVACGQKATFVLHPKIYWGLASEIQEGGQIKSAVLNSDNFFEQNLEGLSEVTVALYGNAEEGYQFKVEAQK